MTNTRRGEVSGSRTAKSAGTDDQDAASGNTRLTKFTHLRQRPVACVTMQGG
jgi:hypothetical protein